MKYSLGLDLGTTSIGWAVLNEDKKRIEDCGVRIFEIPENPKNGESLARPRRDARSTRRRLRRRRQRLNYLKRFFVENNLLDEKTIENVFTRNEMKNPYELRVKALNEKVSNEELFVALYNIAKRRGYKSNRKKVEENSSENGRVLKAIGENSKLLEEYKYVAIALLNNDKFRAHKRNKLDNYTNSFIREDFEKEIIAILKTQEWDEKQINDLLYHKPDGLFYQRPFMTEELINKMRGKCPLEKDEPRAPKASYTFELFRLAQDLAHITYNDGIKLSPEQIKLGIEKAKNTGNVTYKALRNAIGFPDGAEFSFDYIRGKQEDYQSMEKHPFCNLKFYHAIKKACTEEDFAKVKSDIDLFDKIGEVLTVNKDDENVKSALKELPLSKETTDNLMGLSFSGFAGHSIKALRKITPFLLEGNTYDKAVELAYPGRFSEKLSGDKKTLPPLSEDERNQITNPVVKRAIGQTRKVINAIIGKYGSPAYVKIECTNELAKSFKERSDIKKRQDENAKNNEKIVENLKSLGITSPTGTQITKWKLREEQLCKCVYCGKSFDEETLTNDSLTDIDHVIPFSRCGNDSLNNKVLVCSECNREKSQCTPYEKWGSDAKRWGEIEERVEASNMPLPKKKRVLSEKIPKEEWNSRALNDTRYIMKFIGQYIKRNLKFSGDGDGKQKVFLPTGFITNYLRKMYHLGEKDRELNNCHHAVDACVIASVTQGQIQKFAQYSKYRELGARYQTVISYDDNGGVHQVTKKEYEEMKYELLPWDRFDEEVKKRTGATYDSGKIEPLDEFRDKFRDFDTYDEDFINKIHPLFVSRMPKRGTGGQTNKETIRSPRVTDDGKRLIRKRLSDCTLDDIENSVLPESDQALYIQLQELWAEKGKDAFKEPVWKNDKRIDKNGRPIDPVSTIKVYTKDPETSGFKINNGTQFVNNGKTVCLNIYKRNGKFFAAPVYKHMLGKENIPILPSPKGSSKIEKAEYESLKSEDGLIYASKKNGFEFVNSIYPNDYVRFVYKDKVTEGYYCKYGITSGQINLLPHNQASKDSYVSCSVGGIIDVNVMNVSVLGDNYKEA